MYRIISLATMLIVVNLLASAQYFTIEQTQKLTIPANERAFYPAFSPNGEFLIFTNVDYSGLKTLQLSNAAVRTITTDAGAGYQAQISADGQKVLYRSTSFVNNIRRNALVEQTLVTGERKQIVAPTREALPARFVGNDAGYVSERRMVRPQNNATTTRMISIENKKMVLYENNTRRELTPNGANESYFWPSVSPDGKQIVYTVAAKGTFVCDINGRNVRSLGKLGAPKWLNNLWIVGMNDIDDGEKIISSDIYIVSADAKKRQKITPNELRIAMYPAPSADGRRIAFNTDKGELYIMNIVAK